MKKQLSLLLVSPATSPPFWRCMKMGCRCKFYIRFISPINHGGFCFYYY